MSFGEIVRHPLSVLFANSANQTIAVKSCIYVAIETLCIGHRIKIGSNISFQRKNLSILQFLCLQFCVSYVCVSCVCVCCVQPYVQIIIFTGN